jgi:hypothetical protein
MDPALEELIQEAIPALKLRDIILFQSRFTRPTPLPVASTTFEARQLSKREVRFAVGEAQTDGESSCRLLQVYVDLGLRVADLNEKNPSIFLEIEADFMVEYELLSDVSEPAIKAFADINSVHNVWPFWRQHVFDIVSRGRLPYLEIPLFSGIRKRPSHA